MKKILLILLVVFIISSCSSENTTSLAIEEGIVEGTLTEIREYSDGKTFIKITQIYNEVNIHNEYFALASDVEMPSNDNQIVDFLNKNVRVRYRSLENRYNYPNMYFIYNEVFHIVSSDS